MQSHARIDELSSSSGARERASPGCSAGEEVPGVQSWRCPSAKAGETTQLPSYISTLSSRSKAMHDVADDGPSFCRTCQRTADGRPYSKAYALPKSTADGGRPSRCGTTWALPGLLSGPSPCESAPLMASPHCKRLHPIYYIFVKSLSSLPVRFHLISLDIAGQMYPFIQASRH